MIRMRRAALPAFLLAMFAATAAAELLHVEMSDSALDFEGAAGLAYDAGSDGFTVDAAVKSLKVGGDSRALPAGTTLRIRLRVSGAGVAAGGGADQDLEISGTLDLDGDGTAEYASPLLTGTFHGFGYENGAPDKFDFRFQVTGGSLAGVIGDMVGVAVTSGNSTFTGRFDASFAGDAAGTLASVAGAPAGAIDLAPAAGAAGAVDGGAPLAGDGGPAPVGAPGGVTADAIYAATGVAGGLVVDVGCGGGELTVDLRKGDAYLVHGIDTDAADVAAAREHIASHGLYGPVSADRFSGASLPYVDDLVRLFVIQDMGALTMDEVMRALAPGGVAYLWNGSAWEMHTKPRPAGIDDWPQYMYDATNNAVSHDVVSGPPRHLQWVGSPRWSRHHDRMASCGAMVTAAGRVFYIMDEGPISSIELPSEVYLTARDAFSGAVLWKRRIGHWQSAMYPFKSGPAQLPRRLVTDGLYAYATLGLDDPLQALDAVDGRTVRVYEETRATEEVILSEGVLFCLRRDPPTFRPHFIPLYKRCQDEKPYVEDAWAWDPAEARDVVAVQAASGTVLWTASARAVMPMTLTADDRSVYFHDGVRLVCLDRATGVERWQSPAVERKSQIATCFGPTLVAHGEYVLFAGSGTNHTMSGFDRNTGAHLWTQAHHRGGHNSPEDLLILPTETAGSGVMDLAWSGEITAENDSGHFTGRSLATGADMAHFDIDPEYSYAIWKHHRCHRCKATDKYLLVSRRGIEYLDPDASASPHWTIHHWVRGGCLYGVMPANGLTYVPPHNCACYLQSKLYGFSAMAPESASRASPGAIPEAGRLEQGPAYGDAISGAEDPAVDWPTYRHDAARSGATPAAVATDLAPAWRRRVGGTLSALTAAEGRLYVCSIDAHRVVALDAGDGRPLWSYTAGGRVDSPPSVHNGRVLFGCADGYVYCLRATDGELAWRFRVAPVDQRLGAWEQVESVWPLHGSVLVRGGVVYALAGRSMFLDGGLRMAALDPATGALVHPESLCDDKVPGGTENLQTLMYDRRLPVALPDVLSCDDDYIYMRAQRFDFQGVRQHLDRYAITDQTGTGAHLFGSTGFLDGTWFHRGYWIYGKDHREGAPGWPEAGQNAPAGRILSLDGSGIYGYGRKPEYYQWWTPMEYHLYASGIPGESYVDAGKPDNPLGVPLTVEAWVRIDGADGAVVARGGGTNGYALVVQGGKPRFAICTGSTRHEAASPDAIAAGTWVHLAGVLRDGTPNPTLEIYVNGTLKATAAASALLASNPGDPMQIGTELGNAAVGTYPVPFGFNGAIDEAAVYVRALDAAEILAHGQTPGAIAHEADLVLHYSFNEGTVVGGTVQDQSGKGNDGTVTGARTATGVAGTMALAFANSAGAPDAYRWSREVPLHVRAMAKTGAVLLVAGPADVVDEEYAFEHFDDRRMQSRLRQQALALEGTLGGTMHVVSLATGDTLAEVRLSVVPVWDGMAVAGGRVYLAMTDGTVVCFGPR